MITNLSKNRKVHVCILIYEDARGCPLNSERRHPDFITLTIVHQTQQFWGNFIAHFL